MKIDEKTLAWLLPLVILIAALAAVGCKPKPLNPFPQTGAVDGWAKTSEVRTFKPADLWQYIDGDSEQYIKAGVANTLTADYKFKDSIEATVDVYAMSNETGAKTMLEAGPVADAKQAAVGDEARLYGQSLSFRKGKYLVRIVSFTAAPGLSDGLVALGKAVAEKL